MPPLVGVAIAAIASSGAIGTALGLGASIAATISGTVAAALDTSVVIGDIAAGAAVGAAAGAGTAVAGGTSVSKGLLYGAATGGATAGLTPEIAGATGLSTDASQAIASGVVTTGSTLAQGVPLGTALEYGATAGAGSYAGSQISNAIGTPSTSPAPSADQTIQPTSPFSPIDAPMVATSPTGAQVEAAPPPAVDLAPVQVTPQKQLYGSNPVESVTSTADQSSATAPETVISTGIDQSNVAVTAPDILNDQGTKTLEKGALQAALFSLLFPQGGGQYKSGSQSSSTTPLAASGGAPAASGGAGGATLSPAALSAINAVGQTGSTSLYAPGGPLFGSPSGDKYNAWNQASLRTPQGNS